MHFDTLVRGGLVVDGSGHTTVPHNAGILDDRIAVVDRLDSATATRVIDATGAVVVPGFIDVHVHSALVLIGGPYQANRTGRHIGMTIDNAAVAAPDPTGCGRTSISPST